METEQQAPAADPDLTDFYDALAKAHATFPAIKKSKKVKVYSKRTNSYYQFNYAPLEEIVEAVRKPLAEQGLSLMQRVIEDQSKAYVETMLVGRGRSVGNRVPILVLDTGPQAYNSALTYARRAGVTLLLCIAAEDDDDGNAAEGNQVGVTDEEGVPLERQERVALAQQVVDKDTMAEYVKRIQSDIDNADPGGALVLYRELNQLEKDYIWPLLAGKVGKTERTYRGVLRQAAKDAAGGDA